MHSYSDRVAALNASEIDEMELRRHDLEFQLALCREMMARGDILPYPFERAFTLLVKAKHLEEALRLGAYVEGWCVRAETAWDGRSAKVWLSPRLEKIRRTWANLCSLRQA